MNAPAPSGSRTILGGTDTPPDIALDPTARVPVSNDNTMSWIRRASDQTDLDPYTYLSLARNKYHLDQYDDNLAAAERYFDALQGNISRAELVGDAAFKASREMGIAGFKPIEKLAGKNGSKAIEFVTRWGMLGAEDRSNGRTHLDRIKAYPSR